MFLEEKLAACKDTSIVPTSDLVEALRTGVLPRSQPQSLEPLREQPVDHFVVQPPAVTLAFVLWLHEECPNVACLAVADSEANDSSFELYDPTFARALNGDDYFFVRNDPRSQAVLTD